MLILVRGILRLLADSGEMTGSEGVMISYNNLQRSQVGCKPLKENISYGTEKQHVAELEDLLEG